MIDAAWAMLLAVTGTVVLVTFLVIIAALGERFEAVVRQWGFQNGYRIVYHGPDVETEKATAMSYAVIAADRDGKCRRGWLSWPEGILFPSADQLTVRWDDTWRKW